MSIPLIIDAHEDLAWNMLTWGRDYTRPVAETRRLEQGGSTVERNGDCLIGWPEYQRGRVAVVFATLFASPVRTKMGDWDKAFYADAEQAHQQYWDQLQLYRRLADSKPDCFRLIGNLKELGGHMAAWQEPAAKENPVGLILLMEGAEGIRTPDELAEWHAQGLRLIGLSWAGTRYAGGTREPGPLTEDGRRLLKAMAEFNFTLDLSHMDEASALEALDLYEGPIVISHANCLELLPGFETNRHVSDRVIRGVIEHAGVMGVVPLNAFLKTGWKRQSGSRREEVPLDVVAAHIDHICQLAGDARHAGIGSDFDGGFGLQSVPPEIDTIADLHKLIPLLIERGYSASDAGDVLGGNWLRFLQSNLPAS